MIVLTKSFDRMARATAYAEKQGLTADRYTITKNGKEFVLDIFAPKDEAGATDTTAAATVTTAQADSSAPVEAPKGKRTAKGKAAAKGKKGKAAEAKGEKAPRVALEEANGIKRPKAEGQTGQVWAYCDEQHKKTGAAPTRADALADLQAKGINFHTVSTQYGRWRKFMGISGRLPKAGE